MIKVATIILNRNLPEPTNKLYRHLKRFNGDLTDIFIVEAGSDVDNLSKYCTWHVNDTQTRKDGLRYCRGMNYGLLKLFENDNWDKYDFFFLITNDIELREEKTIKSLIETMQSHSRLGILSPISEKWGEKKLFLDNDLLYFWYIHRNAFFLRKDFLNTIINTDSPNYHNFLFDGSNFYGYLIESELIAKAYANNWGAAITAKVFAEENESYLLEKADLIKTDNFDKTLEIYVSEGRKWLRKKYGFNSRWLMNEYVKFFYDQFFNFNQELKKFKI